jgi:release factor glutamine methyltransferase
MPQLESNPTANDLIRHAASHLAAAGIETARLDAEVLLRHVLGIDRTRLFMRLRDPVDGEDTKAFQSLIDRRLTGEPVAFLTGAREFMGLEFAVGPGVLIPRPETELLVEWAARWLKKRNESTVIDVGAGSGAIILSLAGNLRGAGAHRYVGCDVSDAALAYAMRNRDALGLSEIVHLVRGDLLSWLGTPVDLILANLPYLTPEQLASNPDLRAEPELALVSGADGVDAIERLIADLPRVLAPGGAAAFELDPGQAERIAGSIGRALPGARVAIMQDLAGLDRFVIAETA